VSRELLLALDVGTTGARALLVAADGRVLARAYHPLVARFPSPGRVEQDPAEMWKRSRELLREALAAGGARAGDVAGIGVVTQRAAAVAWDARSGEPLGPVIGWQDRRAAPRVAELRRRGIPISTLPTATRFEWQLRNQPAVAGAAKAGRLRLGHPDAWLTDRLTGGAAHVTDPGQASCSGLYDLAGGGWSAAACELFGIEPAWLPELRATSETVGETPPELLGAPVPVAARAGDQQAASFAQGVHARGEAKLTLGTAAMLDLHAGERSEGVAVPRGELARGVFPLVLWRLGAGPEAFCLEGSVVTAGAVVDWLVVLGILPEAAALDAVAGRVASAEGVRFVPALEGLGTPFVEPEVRGLLGGLTRGTSGAHLARAAIEGIAHRCVDVCDALGLDGRPLRVDGGLARSDLLMQTLASLGGRTVLRAAETETTALGAAWLAGLATGSFAGPADCRGLAPPPTPFEPSGDGDRRREARARWRATLERARRGQADRL
jgi:glycerol kinase